MTSSPKQSMNKILRDQMTDSKTAHAADTKDDITTDLETERWNNIPQVQTLKEVSGWLLMAVYLL